MLSCRLLKGTAEQKIAARTQKYSCEDSEFFYLFYQFCKYHIGLPVDSREAAIFLFPSYNSRFVWATFTKYSYG